jgi:hypothetical protein
MLSIVKKSAFVVVAIVGASTFYAAPAAAQATRTWISGVGDDANPCSRTAPCKTFAGAISKTAAGGEINCIDPGGFGAVTITKAISLICDDVEAGVLVAGSPAITINAGDADVVTVSGLDILGPTTVPGTNAINFVNGAGLNLRNTTIKGFATQAVSFTPGAGKTAFLNLNNVDITGNGNTGDPTTGAIKVAPATGATANVVISNTRIQNNVNVGLRFDTTGTTGSRINVQLTDSQLSGDGIGIQFKAPAGTGTINALVTDTTVSNNVSYGIFANGNGVNARFATTTITGNGAAVAAAATGVNAVNASVVSSYGNNRLDGNFNSSAVASDGAFTATIPLH